MPDLWTVEWSIDLPADTPEAAALEAARMQAESFAAFDGATATCYEVTPYEGRAEPRTVDIADHLDVDAKARERIRWALSLSDVEVEDACAFIAVSHNVGAYDDVVGAS